MYCFVSILLNYIRMVNIWCVVVSFLLIGVASGGQISSGSKHSDIPTIKGRLLTPDEGCGYSKVANTRIVGGSAAKNGAWPWMALLGYKEDGETGFVCAGTLITSRHVLSAAHCTKTKEMNSTKGLVRLGEYDISKTSDGEHQDIPIDYILRHEAFDGYNMINDIAIVYLKQDVEFSDRIRPICLPVNNSIAYRDFVDTMPFVAGWGITSTRESAEEPSDILNQVQIPVVDTATCEEKYRHAKENAKNKKIKKKKPDAKMVFDEHIICAGRLEGDKGICNGDSGGPLMLPVFENGTFPFYQIGIVSGSDGCGQPGILGIFQKVQYYADWIHNKLKK